MTTSISIIGLIFFVHFSAESHFRYEVEKETTERVIIEVDNEVDRTMDNVLNEAGENVKKGKTDIEEIYTKQNGSNSFVGSYWIIQDDTSKKELKAWSKYDFIAGEKIIFEDDLTGEKHGEFPSKWNLKSGNAEIAKLGKENVIAFVTNKTEIMPLMKTANYLPEIFTIEFDIYFYNKYNEAYYLNLKNQREITLRTTKVAMENFEGEPAASSKGIGWHHIALSFNQRALKVYFDQTRVLNIPNLEKKPTEMSISALSHGAGKGDPSMIRNIRIAEGGVELYNKLLTEGKIVTRGILFDVGKSTIKPESMGIINEVVTLMNEHPDIKFRIEGHTDSDGDEAFNLKLSEDRATAVKDAIVNLGIDAARLETKGWGESKSLNNNLTLEDKANNRRVEFVKI